MIKPCEYGDGACTAPDTNCQFWNGASCELNADKRDRRAAKVTTDCLAANGVTFREGADDD